ncbi:ATP-binding protein [Yinghuangia sp. YIM S09857]|uniref:ATP-binding protein n=1 Tax=Yinghuangia sp. YIM S09857 TaxID=3436929 RepID=UPI003F536A25
MPERQPTPPSLDRAHFLPVAESVSAARRFTARTLDAWALPHLRDDACLCVSELVTNAVLHAYAVLINVTLALHPDRLRIEVTDDEPANPAPDRLPSPDPDDEGGRGLLLIAALGADSGWTTDLRGKTAWVDFPLTP